MGNIFSSFLSLKFLKEKVERRRWILFRVQAFFVYSVVHTTIDRIPCIVRLGMIAIPEVLAGPMAYMGIVGILHFHFLLEGFTLI